jgi:exodeoxyribonuclease VIII
MSRAPQKSMLDPNAIHVMFDIETLGAANDAPIVQIGAVLFNPFVGNGIISAPGTEFNMHVDFDLAGADQSTLLWWFAQGQQAQQRVFGRDLPRAALRDVLVNLGGWATTWGKPVDFWWSDMDFDLRMLRAAWARELGDPCPFGSEDGPHRGVRDCRTMRAVGKLLGVEEVPFVGVEHDALDDAHHQAVETSNILRALAARVVG